MAEKLLFATSNPHKLREVREIFKDQYQIVGLDSIGFDQEIPETQGTIEGNAAQKARYLAGHTRLPVFAEDTGLLVDALDGAPGVHSARYAGFGSSDKENVEKLLEDMEGLNDRNAHFLTVVAYYDHQNEPVLFHGKIEGKIIDQPRGTQGFGYDPVFMPEGYEKTFAELDASIKNRISHRKRAFDSFFAYFEKINGRSSSDEG